ncbi:MAG: CpaD family pilus assembly lipoprotein [Alphaproteobacteria bacterium]|jgi:type IV pilus biogenesis protein CpaD/CtpE|nr:CpaD family pilus assembly lipoprotein [Alphaproteobacteria bacterium]
MKRTLHFLTATAVLPLLLAACSSAGQTPLNLQEPLEARKINTSYAEDRITLHFDYGQSSLSGDQAAYIERFVRYYGSAKDSAFFISLLVAPEDEEAGRLPAHDPSVSGAITQINQELLRNGVRARVIREIDTNIEPAHIHARAQKAIIDGSAGDPSAEGDPALAALAPNPKDLMRTTKISVLVREYTAEAANCPKTGHWDWRTADAIGNGITLGCATSKNLIAQIKDKSVLASGKPLDDTYAPDAEITRLRQVQNGSFELGEGVGTSTDGDGN